MAIKSTIKGGMDGEHAHGSARTSYSMQNGRTPIDNSRADEVAPAADPVYAAKQEIINAGNKLANDAH
jgi:hypothetical protein